MFDLQANLTHIILHPSIYMMVRVPSSSLFGKKIYCAQRLSRFELVLRQLHRENDEENCGVDVGEG